MTQELIGTTFENGSGNVRTPGYRLLGPEPDESAFLEHHRQLASTIQSIEPKSGIAPRRRDSTGASRS